MIRNWLLADHRWYGRGHRIAWQGTLVATPLCADVHGDGTHWRERSGQPAFGFGKLSTADNQPIVRPSPDLGLFILRV